MAGVVLLGCGPATVTLWVRIRKLGDRGTMVELTGAVVAKDVTKAKPAAPKAASERRK